MHCTCKEGKAKCTSCASLQRGLKLHAYIYKDVVQERVVVLSFEIEGGWLLHKLTPYQVNIFSLWYTVLQVCVVYSNSYNFLNHAWGYALILIGSVTATEEVHTDTVQFSDWNSFDHGSCSVSVEKYMVSCFHKWKSLRNHEEFYVFMVCIVSKYHSVRNCFHRLALRSELDCTDDKTCNSHSHSMLVINFTMSVF